MNTKKFIPIIAGALLNNSCVSQKFTNLELLEILSTVPPKYSDNLKINNSSEERFFVKMGEQEGVDQMRVLSMFGSLEEGWSFIPKENLWVEVGKESTFIEMKIDVDYMVRQFLLYDDVSLYHTHPAENRRGTFYLDPRLSIHSLKDITSMIIGSSVFYDIKPNGNFSSKVVSMHGVVDCTLTQRGKEYFKRNVLEAQDHANSVYERINSVIFVPDVQPQKRIDLLTRVASDEFISFKFKPYEN